jgi:predicted metal-binding membrane protein
MLLLQGDVRASVRFHAFAPIFIILISGMMLATFLPKIVTDPFINKAETLERQTGLTVIILSGLILYWLGRLLFFPTAFAQLIRG